MNNFEFWFSIQGIGDTPKEAWDDALDKFAAAWMRGKEWNNPPADIFDAEDPNGIPSAEILGGSLSGGFGIDHGPEDLGEDAQRAADIDEMIRDKTEEGEDHAEE